MHPKWVVVARVVAVDVVIGISAVVWTFGSLLFRHLFPIEEVVVVVTSMMFNCANDTS
jgi:hypothetical protein